MIMYKIPPEASSPWTDWVNKSYDVTKGLFKIDVDLDTNVVKQGSIIEKDRSIIEFDSDVNIANTNLLTEVGDLYLQLTPSPTYVYDEPTYDQDLSGYYYEGERFYPISLKSIPDLTTYTTTAWDEPVYSTHNDYVGGFVTGLTTFIDADGNEKIATSFYAYKSNSYPAGTPNDYWKDLLIYDMDWNRTGKLSSGGTLGYTSSVGSRYIYGMTFDRNNGKVYDDPIYADYSFDTSTPWTIYKHDGMTSTVLDYFHYTPIGDYIRALEMIDGDLLITEWREQTLRVMDGFSNTVKKSLPLPIIDSTTDTYTGMHWDGEYLWLLVDSSPYPAIVKYDYYNETVISQDIFDFPSDGTLGIVLINGQINISCTGNGYKQFYHFGDTKELHKLYYPTGELNI